MTKDDILVVNHDPEFNGLPVESTDYKTLVNHKLSNGESLPTLEEYLKAGSTQNFTKLIL